MLKSMKSCSCFNTMLSSLTLSLGRKQSTRQNTKQPKITISKPIKGGSSYGEKEEAKDKKGKKQKQRKPIFNAKKDNQKKQTSQKSVKYSNVELPSTTKRSNTKCQASFGKQLKCQDSQSDRRLVSTQRPQQYQNYNNEKDSNYNNQNSKFYEKHELFKQSNKDSKKIQCSFKIDSIQQQSSQQQSQSQSLQSTNKEEQERGEVSYHYQSIHLQQQQSAVNKQKSSTSRQPSLQQQSLDLSQSDQYQLDTEKSQYIINDMNLSVGQNQNKFLNSLISSVDFDKVYREDQVIEQTPLFIVMSITDRVKDKKRTAYKLRGLDHFRQEWKRIDCSSIGHGEDDILERYEELFSSLKDTINCLAKMSKKNCRYTRQLIDYDFRPPTFQVSENVQEKHFKEGSLILVFENIDSTLDKVLADDKNNALSKTDKKVTFQNLNIVQKLIYQLLIGVEDLHACGIIIGNFSLKNIGLDMFNNIKISGFSYRVDNADQNAKCSDLHKILAQEEQSLFFLPPEQLGLNKNTLNSKFSAMQYSIDVDHLGRKSDLWSIGALIVKLLTGKYIFSQKTKQAQLKSIESLVSPDIQKTASLSTRLLALSLNEIKLVESLLKWNADERVECTELLKMEYFQNLLEQ